MAAWAREAGLCETQLCLRCRRAGVTAKQALDLIRLLRAVLWRNARGGYLRDYSDVVDPRTLARLVERTGLSELEGRTVVGCLDCQRV